MADELNQYRRKRRHERTPEPGVAGPEGGGGESSRPAGEHSSQHAGEAPRFVVDWHSARRLHFDLRLELDGVAKSWAVPKGPPLWPGVKRLAVQTEDHPLEYLDWEGDIPEGEYGGGKLRIWDRGTFELEKRTDGELKVLLHGEKLEGSYVLVKTRGDREWLLMRHRADGGDRAGARYGAERRGFGHSGDLAVDGPQRLPPLRPMLACPGEGEGFDDPAWSFELKWDGVRTLAFVADGEVLLRSRGDHDVSAAYPELGALYRNVRATEAVLDGEIVALDERGVSDFQLLQSRLNRRDAGGPGAAPIVFYVFDLLLADGEDLCSLAWRERRARLEQVLEPDGSVRLSEAVDASGTALYQAAIAQGAEGVIAKRRDSPYRPGARSSDWLKLKHRETGTFAVGGYTRGSGRRGASFGALLAGEERDGVLHYVGSVGTGFTDASLDDALERLRPLERPTSPFTRPPKLSQPVTWVEPRLCCEVEFAHRTHQGKLRAPSFRRWVGHDAPGAEPPVGDAAPGAEHPVDNVAPGAGGSAAGPGAEDPAESAAALVTNPGKVFWPEAGITKGDLVAYYEQVAPYILPHLQGRPMVMNRFPNGWEGKSFYQKNVSEHRPEWVETVSLPADEGRKTIDYALCPDTRHLLWLANLGCIEMNPWLSRLPDLSAPTQVLFDLDPNPPATFSQAAEVALLLREVLDRLGLEGFAKTSGGKGMHVMVPIEAGLTHEFARLFAEGVAQSLERAHPNLVTTHHARERRGARVLVDFRQNRQGSTIASVYSVRPRAGAPVSTPLRWEEVDPALDPSRFTFETVLERCRQDGDLFAGVLERRQGMAEAVEALPGVLAG